MNYSLSDIARICGGRLDGCDGVVDSVTTDSRSFAGYGCARLFFAIGGRNHDGHNYIGELYEKGVRGFVVEKDIVAQSYPGAGFVVVGSSIAALQRLAADYRAGFKGVVVGVTGSNGKTIVKEWISSLAPMGIKLFRSPRSYNSQIGVPLSLLLMRGDEDVAVIEVGISRPGEMERLERIVKPDVVVLTTIGAAHQENFLSLSDKAREKLILARGAKKIIYNGGYEELARLLLAQYGSHELYDASACRAAYDFFDDCVSGENSAAAVTLWDALEYDHAATISRLPALGAIAMRLELREGVNGSIVVNDTYNSDINSLAIAIDYLRSVAGQRPMTLIMSDILQSGQRPKELYTNVANMVRAAGINHFVGVGHDTLAHRSLFDSGSEFYGSTTEFLSTSPSRNIAGHAVLIKGNRDSRLESVSHALELLSHTTTLEVDLDAMIYNLEAHRRLLLPGTKVMAMVKAGSYGNGNYEVANMLQSKGVDYLAVAYADEGVALRRAGITMPVVVLNADSDSFDIMVSYDLEPEIYDFVSLRAFAATVRRHGAHTYPIHIKVDTGMRRLGFEPEQALELGLELKGYCGELRVATLFSHLAASDDPTQDAFTDSQIAEFERFCSAVSREIGYRPARHIANSAAILRLPQAQFEMVRLGIGLYGVGAIDGVPLRRVSTLCTRIVQVKSVAPGQTIGYGRQGIVGRVSRVATIPVGYADGLDRKLGNGNWSMSVGSQAAPTIGRICMDTCMIDITDTDAAQGDRVVIFGPDQGCTVEEMAKVLDTIPYEVMTSVSERVKRVFLKE